MPFEKIEKRIPKCDFSSDYVSLENDSIKVKIEKRDLARSEIDSLSQIDVWGTDTGNPINKIIKLSVTIKGRQIQIDNKYYSDLYHVNLENTYGLIHNNCLIICMSNSDGAGFYEVSWVLNNSKLLKRQINLGP